MPEGYALLPSEWVNCDRIPGRIEIKKFDYERIFLFGEGGGIRLGVMMRAHLIEDFESHFLFFYF